MAPLVDGKIYFALTLMNKEPRKISLTSALLFASLAILAPLALAQQCGCNLATPTFNPIYTGGLNPCTYYSQNARNCKLVKFSRDSISGDAANGKCDTAGDEACPSDGGTANCAKEGTTNCEPMSVAMPGNNSGNDSGIQLSNARVRLPNRLTSTEPSFSRTSSSSLRMWDGFPSISLFLSTSC
jgi:hypothetical protein